MEVNINKFKGINIKSESGVLDLLINIIFFVCFNIYFTLTNRIKILQVLLVICFICYFCLYIYWVMTAIINRSRFKNNRKKYYIITLLLIYLNALFYSLFMLKWSFALFIIVGTFTLQYYLKNMLARKLEIKERNTIKNEMLRFFCFLILCISIYILKNTVFYEISNFNYYYLVFLVFILVSFKFFISEEDKLLKTEIYHTYYLHLNNISKIFISILILFFLIIQILLIYLMLMRF